MKRTKLGGMALLAVSALLATACGSSSKTSSTTAATGVSTTTASGTSATTTATPTSTSAQAGPPGLAKAKQTVVQFLQRPISSPITTPVGKPIPTGKKVTFITCGVPVCEKEGPIIKEATDLLGWSYEKISTDGTQTSISNAWDQAVREKPDVVLYTAFARSQIETQIKALSQGGTFISSCCVTDPEGNGIGYVIGTPAQTGSLGGVMASWVVADANGATPGVVYLDLPEFAILSSLATEFQSNFKQLCPDCSFTKLNFALADLGTAADKVVSYLRSNTNVKYVIMSTDSAFSLAPAIAASGLPGIRIFGEGPGEANLSDILSGKQAASMYFDYYGYLFAMVDAAARHFAGADPVPSQPPTAWILTKDNLPSTDPSVIFPSVVNVKALFTKLWGK